ncbi:helicase [Cryptosporidium ubiquitum]|uniref:DNA 3'-5' helicase n=1 Tax=Cryptosporidium ubiquitum TaxID=857276 RepID=A0A1J4MHR6_9CRYT|nr:helicase [Cryptosporidium ubiquitum]OII73752.1 helicase [Cryptosporidium ubiquitum]
MSKFNEQIKELNRNSLTNFEKDEKIHSMLFGRLTCEQKKAVFMNHESSLLIVAGPGTGKTATLTSRIVRFLLSGYSPILALTFTRKAANELKSRVSTIYTSSAKIMYAKLKNLKSSSQNDKYLSDFISTPEIFIGTIHSFCWKVLKEYGTFIDLPKDITIIDKEMAFKLLKSCISEDFNTVSSKLSDYSSLIFDPINYDEIERDDFDGDNEDDEVGDKTRSVEIEQLKNLNNNLNFLKKETDDDGQSTKNELEKILKIIKLLKIKKYINKNECTIDDVNGNHKLFGVYLSYTKKMAMNKPYLLDYTDLIILTLRLLENNIKIREEIQDSYPYIFCDEFQDTSKLQFKILELLTRSQNKKRKFGLEEFLENESLKKGGITVVGDDDQAIYSWRGVDTGVFSQFSSIFKQNFSLVYLTTNFRSSKSIIAVSNYLIKNNKSRIIKSLTSNNGPGIEPAVYYFSKQIDEMQWIASTILLFKIKYNYSWSDFAILARTNDTLFYIEKLFSDKQFLISCIEMFQDTENINQEKNWFKMISNDLLNFDINQLNEFKSLEIIFPMENTSRSNPKSTSDLLSKTEILDILSYCRLIVDETADDCFLRVCNRPKRGIGDNAIKLIEDYGAQGISLMRKSTQPLNGICELSNGFINEQTNTYKSIMNVCRMLVSNKLEIRSKFDHSLYKKTINSIKLFLESVDDLKKFVKNKVSVREIINEIVKKMNLDYRDINNKDFKKKKISPSNSFTNLNYKIANSEKANMRKLSIFNSISALLKYSEPYTPNEEQPTGYECLLCFLQDASNGLLQIKKGEKISLSTIHKAKGLEWKVVFIPKFIDKIFPLYRETEYLELKNEFNEIISEEERRIAYVAFTRAKERLLISVPLNVGKPSPFIQDANLPTYNRVSKKKELIKQCPRIVTGKNWIKFH